MAILIDRRGGMWILDPEGWSLPALGIEYGAAAVYKVQRRGVSVRVEGWDGSRRCPVQRAARACAFLQLPGAGAPAQTILPLCMAPAAF